MRYLVFALVLFACNVMAAASFESVTIGPNGIAVGDASSKLTQAIGKPDKVEQSRDGISWVYDRNDRHYVFEIGSDGRITSIKVGND